jgi:hypothetical protein
LGFPTGRSFTSLITRQQVLLHYSSPRHQQVFLVPLLGNEEEEEEAPTSTMRQQNTTKRCKKTMQTVSVPLEAHLAASSLSDVSMPCALVL